jgi:hypothetical protein
MALALGTPLSSLSLFLPTLTASLGYSDLQAQLMTIPSYAVAYVLTLITAWSADHHNAYDFPKSLCQIGC